MINLLLKREMGNKSDSLKKLLNDTCVYNKFLRDKSNFLLNDLIKLKSYLLEEVVLDPTWVTWCDALSWPCFSTIV